MADRLFKIHNSLNLQGVFQQLPLFDPPIDPALLVRAAAAGLDVSAIVSGLNQPLPLVRFQLLVAKATEICQEVKSLGGGLLAAMEKKDNEALALLRAQHETNILGLAEMVKYCPVAGGHQGAGGTGAVAGQRGPALHATTRSSWACRTTRSASHRLIALDENSLETFSFQSERTANATPAHQRGHLAGLRPRSAMAKLKTLSSHEVEELNKLEQARDFAVNGDRPRGIASG